MKAKWRDKPTIMNTIPKDDRMLFFIDESGEESLKKIKKAYEAKRNGNTFSERNDVYILNGIAITGENHNYLQKNSTNLKKKYFENGKYNYKKYGERPLLFRNHEIVAKNPPFDNVPQSFFNEISKLIARTKFKQIVVGINYYCFTEKNLESENMNPLLSVLGKLVTNYAYYLNSINKKGMIIFEEETEIHDKLKLNFIKKLIYSGNNSHDKKFYGNITGVYFRKKWTEERKGKFVTTSGLEMADLTISPIRRILNPEYITIESKLLNYPKYRNFGLSFIL